MPPEITSPAISELVASVIDRTPDLGQGAFTTNVARRIAEAFPRLQERLARGGGQPGSQALVAVVEVVEEPV